VRGLLPRARFRGVLGEAIGGVGNAARDTCAVSLPRLWRDGTPTISRAQRLAGGCGGAPGAERSASDLPLVRTVSLVGKLRTHADPFCSVETVGRLLVSKCA
jgi:hypothetical protein